MKLTKDIDQEVRCSHISRMPSSPSADWPLQVENKNVPLPEFPKHPFQEEHLKQLYKIVPMKDIRNLYVTFPIPDLQKYYKSNPGHYLSHLISHEGPGSLLSDLKGLSRYSWWWAEGKSLRVLCGRYVQKDLKNGFSKSSRA
ncbi:hypothetical protein GH733_005638 [Mirounga leonina]|nr:hypothetical protein GH733_005638 [Mirounga leonina]